MCNILVMDPGNSTGCVHRIRTTSDIINDREGRIVGFTIVEDLPSIYSTIAHSHPDIVIYESFRLYPGKATKMIGNAFYPVQVIGVIRCVCEDLGIKQVVLNPSDKEFSGVDSKPSNPEFKKIEMYQGQKITEHVRDAYRLLRFFERHKTQLERKPK